MQGWRWSDQEFDFNDKWFKACKQEDAYIYLPVSCNFIGDFKVEIGTRVRHGINEHRPTRTIDDYRNVTIKSLRSLYLEMVEETKGKETPK